MWLPLLLCFGLLVGAFCFRAFLWLRTEMRKPTFLSCGFEYGRCGPYEGWLNRDPHNGDWIIWCVKKQAAFRGPNSDALRWLPSPESEAECMRLGRLYSSNHKKTRRRRRWHSPVSG